MFGHLKNKGIILTLWLDDQGSNPAIKDFDQAIAYER
jgi:hypothetical protein